MQYQQTYIHRKSTIYSRHCSLPKSLMSVDKMWTIIGNSPRICVIRPYFGVFVPLIVDRDLFFVAME